MFTAKLVKGKNFKCKSVGIWLTRTTNDGVSDEDFTARSLCPGEH